MENQIKEAVAKFEALVREQLARNEKIKAQKEFLDFSTNKLQRMSQARILAQSHTVNTHEVSWVATQSQKWSMTLVAEMCCGG